MQHVHTPRAFLFLIVLMALASGCGTGLRMSFERPTAALDAAAQIHQTHVVSHEGGLFMSNRYHGVEVLDGADVPVVRNVIGDIESYEGDLAAAKKELAERAADLGADVIYGFSPIMGYGCGSPTGPQDIVVQGWVATAAVRSP